MESEEGTTFFINLVANKPVLYDKKRTEFKNIALKSKVWDEIGHQCNVSGDVAKKKYTSLREKFSREKRRNQQAERNGSEVISSWVFMKSLQFLDPFVEGRATATNEYLEITNPNCDDDEEHASETTTTSPAAYNRNMAVVSTSSSSPGFAISTHIFKTEDEEISVATVRTATPSSDEAAEDAIPPPQAKRMKSKNKEQSCTLDTIHDVAKTLKIVTERVNSQVEVSNNSRFLAYCDEMLLKMTPKRAEIMKRKINYLLLDELELQELERN